MPGDRVRHGVAHSRTGDTPDRGARRGRDAVRSQRREFHAAIRRAAHRTGRFLGGSVFRLGPRALRDHRTAGGECGGGGQRMGRDMLRAKGLRAEGLTAEGLRAKGLLIGAAVALVSLCLAAPRAQEPLWDTGTFSILGYDPETGEVGGAVQSRVFSVGNGVLWAEANVGVAATQAIVDVGYGPKSLELLRKGMKPADIIKQI